MRARSLFLSVAAAGGLAAVAQAQTGSTPPALPATPAAQALAAYLAAINAGDSASLASYASRYEPGMSVANQLVIRTRSGGFDLRMIERSEPRHLEAIVRTRKRPIMALYIVDVDSLAPIRVSTSITILGDSVDRSALRITAAERAVAVDSLALKIDRNYVDPVLGKAIADSVRVRLARGVYDGDSNRIVFAQHLGRELFAIAHDRHMGVSYNPGQFIPAPAPTGPGAAPAPRPVPPLPPGGCNFNVHFLPDSVAVLEFNSFLPLELCESDASKAMHSVATARALIIDLRTNFGGSVDMVVYLASYFLPSHTHLEDFWNRKTGETTQYWTRDSVPGPRFGGDKPVYVLTSPLTVSAAESLAYILQTLKRATIVGETTGGAANFMASGPIGAHLMLSTSVARSINPITKTSWEGVGVIPDVGVPASGALDAAQRLIRERARH